MSKLTKEEEATIVDCMHKIGSILIKMKMKNPMIKGEVHFERNNKKVVFSISLE